MSNSQDNQLHSIREYVVFLMEQEGRITDNTICEYCLEPCPGNKWEIHHTKYEGATYYDLMVVCRKCNRAPENVGLA